MFLWYVFKNKDYVGCFIEGSYMNIFFVYLDYNLIAVVYGVFLEFRKSLVVIFWLIYGCRSWEVGYGLSIGLIIGNSG